MKPYLKYLMNNMRRTCVALNCCLLLTGMQALAQDSTAPVTLKKPVTETLVPDADGFLRRWLVLEPIPVNGLLTDSAVRNTIYAEHFNDQLSVLPADGDQVRVGDNLHTWHALDTLNYNVNLYHFAWGLQRPTSNVLFWAVTILELPHDMQDVRLAIGSNAASIWWVNGKEVIDIYNDRQSVVDDGVSPRLTLHKGRNIIRTAIINAGGATDFVARILDTNMDPVTDLVQTLE